jgi:hypothetical protein
VDIVDFGHLVLDTIVTVFRAVRVNAGDEGLISDFDALDVALIR